MHFLLSALLSALIIFSAVFYSHLFEYFCHKYVLHDYKRFKYAFKNHFSMHHGKSRKNGMYDEAYLSVVSSKFEIIGLGFIALIHTPIALISPLFYATLIITLFNYYYVHRKSHIDVEWGKENLPWHYAHHMDKNQHQNWGVRSDVIDRIFKTKSY